MADAGWVASGSTFLLRRLEKKQAAEPELAVYLEKDLTVGSRPRKPQWVQSQVLAPAIELGRRGSPIRRCGRARWPGNIYQTPRDIWRLRRDVRGAATRQV